MSDSRPAPRYGEYATPDEVAAALGQPAPPDPGQRLHPDVPPPAPPGAAVPPVPGPRAEPAPARRWDRILTVALLVVGLLYLMGWVPSMLSLDEYLRLSYAQLLDIELDFGILTRIVGQVLLAAITLAYAVSAVAAWRRLRAGRLAFWVPLAGAGATLLLIILGFFVIFVADPGFAPMLERAG